MVAANILIEQAIVKRQFRTLESRTRGGTTGLRGYGGAGVRRRQAALTGVGLAAGVGWVGAPSPSISTGLVSLTGHPFGSASACTG